MEYFLLDTHTAIWFFEDDEKLSETAKQAILNPLNRKYVNIASAWELAIKISIGKMKFKGGVAGFLQLADENGFAIGPIHPDHLTVLETLPMFHRDPFDRLLIAAAIAESMTLITADTNIPQYDVSIIW